MNEYINIWVFIKGIFSTFPYNSYREEAPHQGLHFAASTRLVAVNICRKTVTRATDKLTRMRLCITSARWACIWVDIWSIVRYNRRKSNQVPQILHVRGYSIACHENIMQHASTDLPSILYFSASLLLLLLLLLLL